MIDFWIGQDRLSREPDRMEEKLKKARRRGFQ
jgi:hypothetical protein